MSLKSIPCSNVDKGRAEGKRMQCFGEAGRMSNSIYSIILLGLWIMVLLYIYYLETIKILVFMSQMQL